MPSSPSGLSATKGPVRGVTPKSDATTMSGFSQLIDDVADQKNNSLSDVLLKAKVLAHRLKSRTFRQWVNSEIDGYGDKNKLPDYRIVGCNLRGDFNGYFQ